MNGVEREAKGKAVERCEKPVNKSGYRWEVSNYLLIILLRWRTQRKTMEVGKIV